MTTNKKSKKQRGASVNKSDAVRVSFKLKYVFVLMLVSCAIAGGWGVYTGFDFIMSKPVARVAVTGEFRFVNRESITESIQPLLKDGFMKLDLQYVREQLKRRPWVYDVNISRVWPDEISINVVEQKPIARWAQTGFLNHRGELFEPQKMVFIQELPLLNGPEGTTEKVMTHFQQLGEALRKQGLILRELDLDGRGNWIATLDNKVSIVLGNARIMDKMTRFVTAWKFVLKDEVEYVERIDMRYSNGLAVAWREGRPVADQGRS